jgi:hypothetical protein
MKAINYSFFAFIISIIILTSCDDNDKNDKYLTFNDFCSAAPEGWQCTITTGDFNIQNIPQNAETPIAIIEYLNPNREFTKYTEMKVNPSLIIDIYEIGRKQELMDFIKSQQLYSWCIPIYYGETKDYFIITSPCFINGGSFTDEANACINDLHEALKSIITINDYNFYNK